MLPDAESPGGEVVRLLASRLGEPGSIPGGVAPELVADDAAGRRVFSGVSRFPALAFQCCSIPIFVLIGSQDSDGIFVFVGTSCQYEIFGSTQHAVRHKARSKSITRPMNVRRSLDGLVHWQLRTFDVNSLEKFPACDCTCFNITPTGTHTVIMNRATVAERLDCLPPTKANRVQSPAGPLRIFTSGRRAGRRRWSTGFLRDLSFPSPFFPVLLGTHFISPVSALNNSLNTAQIDSLTLAIVSEGKKANNFLITTLGSEGWIRLWIILRSSAEQIVEHTIEQILEHVDYVGQIVALTVELTEELSA
ncbi:hypothetical protein PR048_014541 [Dryococelus australis]|uniref:Uncharacterized protein n=1 Tax=Dryococelus australis TaxID=614101 RepID=A0ABQ9HFB5_9NEOP|nr:hypothetical protein PR048_014541 [Dryococelus australis]